jgi:hypothetical protein
MKTLTLALSLLVSSAAFAAKIEEELFVMGSQPALLKELVGHADITVDHLDSHGFEVYGPAGLGDLLAQRGVAFYDLKDARKNIDWTNYPTYEQIKAKLEEFAAKYPQIVRLTSIGKTVKGRDLLVLKISDNVAVDEVEPEFKYISSMHGDEITGRELTIRLVDEMLQKYGSDAAITDLINNTEIFVMPSMNPDGSELRQRANAAGQDLNRNFPEAVRNEPNNSAGRQPETQAIMAFQASRNISLSANFHGGAIVANYPWDAKYDRHPFDGLLQELSLEYANLNPEMRSSTEFNRGITNGADWYVLYGGMQDWSYIWHNDLQITVELSDTKWPNYKDIPGFYTSNRDSMIRYMELVHQGAGIQLANRSANGKVEVLNAQGASLGTYGFQRGEFYKVLAPGAYTFKVEADGTRRSINVSVDADKIRANGNYTKL